MHPAHASPSLHPISSGSPSRRGKSSYDMQRRVLITVQAMVMNYAVGPHTVGGFGDVHTLVDLAVAAERHGWDGVHLWDHVLYHESGWPVASPVVAAAAIAASTSRVRIILTVALPRRQVQDIAQDAAGIDALSRRRCFLGWEHVHRGPRCGGPPLLVETCASDGAVALSDGGEGVQGGVVDAVKG